MGVDVVGDWFLISVRFDEQEPHVGLSRFDASDDVLVIEVVFAERIFPVLSGDLQAL